MLYKFNLPFKDHGWKDFLLNVIKQPEAAGTLEKQEHNQGAQCKKYDEHTTVVEGGILIFVINSQGRTDGQGQGKGQKKRENTFEWFDFETCC